MMLIRQTDIEGVFYEVWHFADALQSDLKNTVCCIVLTVDNSRYAILEDSLCSLFYLTQGLHNYMRRVLKCEFAYGRV